MRSSWKAVAALGQALVVLALWGSAADADVRTVGAHYYPWYGFPAHHWHDGNWSNESPSKPVLGNYHSTDDAVIAQHIDWAHAAGVSWFSVSWWGPYSHENVRLRDVLLEHPRAHELEWSVIYETVGRLGEGAIDMDDSRNRAVFRRDLEYLADTYFENPLWQRIDGRPVLYIYVAHALKGDVVGAYEEAVEAAGIRPYLIVDIPLGDTLDSVPITEVADAVTTYNPYAPREDIEEIFLERMEKAYQAWYLAKDYMGVELIPVAIPGFNDSALTHVHRDNPVLTSSPERYRQACEVALRYADGPVLVTSFNEWYEDTQIEPSRTVGEEYLVITSEVLASAKRTTPVIEGRTITFMFETTIPESELNPEVDVGRDLSMLVSKLTVRSVWGQESFALDVGGDEGEALFLLGAFSEEHHMDDSWRWFGGRPVTVVQVPQIPTRGTIEILGRAATEMTVKVLIDGELQGEGRVGESYDTYSIVYGL